MSTHAQVSDPEAVHPVLLPRVPCAPPTAPSASGLPLATHSAPNTPGYQGANTSTNNSAELTALIQSAQHIAQQPGTPQHYEIHADSNIALFAAIGRPQTPKNKPKKGKKVKNQLINLGVRARETVAKAKKLTGGRITLRKTKGHSGNIWNEIADALAAIGRQIASTQDKHNTQKTLKTSELMDRIRRAIEAIGGDEPPDITCHGFSMM